MSSASTSASDAWESLFRTQVAVMRVLRQDFAGAGMSINEYDVLYNIARCPERRIRLRDLNESVLITQSSVSRLIDRLVARGFVEKFEDEFDARSTIVALTAAGVSEFRRVGRIHADSIERHVGGALTEDELATLQELCERLRAPFAPDSKPEKK